MKKLFHWIYTSNFIMYNPDPRVMYQAYEAKRREESKKNQD